MASLMDAPDVLKKIAAYKVDEVAALRDDISIEELREIARDQTPPRGFAKAIQNATGPALICEFNPVEIAQTYEEVGATCLSVLTDGPGFQGSNAIFKQVRGATDLPLLRKDFMLDPIQIAESAAMGADCILVIMAMIDNKTAKALMDEATALGMDALVETHDESELERAIELGASLIGINNRDLRTFDTTLDTFAGLARRVPEGATLIAESGIFTRDDIEKLAKDGAQGYLIGESLMRQDDVARAVRELMN